jgi:hypothetical protein
VAIKTAREMALLPYTQRTVNERGPGRGPARGPRRDDIPSGDGRVDEDGAASVDKLDLDEDEDGEFDASVPGADRDEVEV